MNPRLIDIPSGVEGIGHLTLPSYFAMVTMGFIWGAILLPRWGKRHGIEPRIMVDFVIWLAIWGLLGSRLLHLIADGHFWDYINVCIDPSKVDWKVDRRECLSQSLNGIWDAAKSVCHPSQTNCWAWADLTAGGFAFYGGFVAACIFAVFFVRKHRISGPKLLDMGGWGIMFGLAWGRMGCFLASCCFGAQTDWAVGTVFPKGSSASRYQWEQGLLETYRVESLPVHPTQIYEAIAGLAIATYAYYWVRPRKRFDGQVFCVTCFLYAAARFMLEFLRRDERGGLFGFSTSQLIAIGLAIACVFLWQYFGNRAARLVGDQRDEEIPSRVSIPRPIQEAERGDTKEAEEEAAEPEEELREEAAATPDEQTEKPAAAVPEEDDEEKVPDKEVDRTDPRE